MIGYISVKDAANKWGISERRIQKLCEENRIDSVVRFGRSWAIPMNAQKPTDGRLKENKAMECVIISKNVVKCGHKC